VYKWALPYCRERDSASLQFFILLNQTKIPSLMCCSAQHSDGNHSYELLAVVLCVRCLQSGSQLLSMYMLYCIIATHPHTPAPPPSAVARPPRRLQTSNLLCFPSARSRWACSGLVPVSVVSVRDSCLRLREPQDGMAGRRFWAVSAQRCPEKGTCWRHRPSRRRGDGADDSDVSWLAWLIRYEVLFTNLL